jgi:murein DD-endopeptidase MepM/ murein hydrolase activator NlpD
MRTTRRGGVFAILLLAAAAVLAVGTASAPADPGQGGLGPAPGASNPSSATDTRPIYPIRGAHNYWRGFGAAGHEGVDVGARCGTPLVASMAAKVRWVKYHGSAGNYVVLDTRDTELELVYMHLARTASVRPGQSVAPGELVGFVGDTGNASGCHLHFEVWEGAYYGGGSPVDPMPFLQSWERDRKKRANRAGRGR